MSLDPAMAALAARTAAAWRAEQDQRKAVLHGDGVVHRMTRFSGMWRPACDGPSLKRGMFLADLADPVSADERKLGPVTCQACLDVEVSEHDRARRGGAL